MSRATCAGRSWRAVAIAVTVALLSALFASPARASSLSVSVAAEKGAIPSLGSLPRFSDESLDSASTFSAALSSSRVLGFLDESSQPGEIHPMWLSPGDELRVSMVADSGTDFDLYLYWPTYVGTDDFDIAAASVELDYPEELRFSAAWPGTYYLYVSAYEGSGNYSMDVSIVPADGSRVTKRLWGQTRYETAVAVSKRGWADGASRDVVLASGESFPDALSASALAGALGCPLLLTRPGRLPASVAAELSRLGVRDAHLVGSTAAVSGDVGLALGAMGIDVFRYSGKNRYETSAVVARSLTQLSAFGPPDTVFVARGDVFADALVAAPFAYGRGFPVLLTDSRSLSSEAASAIRSIDPDSVVVLGSQAAVSARVEGQLDSLVGWWKVDRVGGANRYDTAKAVARYGIEHYWATTENMGVACGTDYPDALSGGSLMGAIGGVLVLTEPGRLSAQPRSLLVEQAATGVIEEVTVFGGEKAVSASTYLSIKGVLE